MLVARSAAAFLCVVLFVSLATGQSPHIVKGSNDDLEGMRKVYVDTGEDATLREIVEAQLREQLPDLALVDAPATDTLVVRFGRGYIERRADWDGVDEFNKLIGPKTNDVVVPTRPLPAPGTRTQPTRVAKTPERGAEISTGSPMRREWYALGSVFKPTGAQTFAEVVNFRHIASRGFEGAAKDFVRKLAKEYRKANR